MKRKIGHKTRSIAPILRRLLTVFLAAAYIAVGFGGEICCASESLAAADQIQVNDALTAKSDQGFKKPLVVEHCYTCIPLLIPAPVFVIEPTVEPAQPKYATQTFLLGDHPGLDTPPPKHRT